MNFFKRKYNPPSDWKDQLKESWALKRLKITANRKILQDRDTIKLNPEDQKAISKYHLNARPTPKGGVPFHKKQTSIYSKGT